MKNGLFVVIDGIEGVGKSTQCKLVEEELKRQNYSVVLTQEPFVKPIEKIIRTKDITPVTEYLLFTADRIEHIEKLIKPSLNNGSIVICDRYFYSTIAYQYCGRGLVANKTVLPINDYIEQFLTPDLSIFIDLDTNTSYGRLIKSGRKQDRIEQSGKEFMEKVRYGYLSMHRNQSLFNQTIALLNGDNSREYLTEQILKKIYISLREKL